MKKKLIITLLGLFIIVLSGYFVKQTYSMIENPNYKLLNNNIEKVNSILEDTYDISNDYYINSIFDDNGKVPAYNYYNDIKSRSIKALKAYDNKIFMGLGDWDSNTGPVKILYYNIMDEKIETSGTINDEAVGSFEIIDEKIYTVGRDPRDGWGYGSYYVYNNEENNWSKHMFNTGWIHVYDIEKYNDKLFMCGSVVDSTKRSLVQVSFDNGQSFEDAKVLDANGNQVAYDSKLRAYSMFIYKNKLYVRIYKGSSEYNGIYKYDEENNQFNFIQQNVPLTYPFKDDNDEYVNSYPSFEKYLFATTINFNSVDLFVSGHYLYSMDDIDNKQITFDIINIDEEYAVQNAVVQEDTLYLLANHYNLDGSFNFRIYKTKDLKKFDVLYEHTTDSFPYSMEYFNNNIYVGTSLVEHVKDKSSVGSLYKIDLNKLEKKLILNEDNTITVKADGTEYTASYEFDSSNITYQTTLTFNDNMSREEWEGEYNKLKNMNLLYLLYSDGNNINYNSAITYYNNILNNNIDSSSEYNSAAELYNAIFANNLNIQTKRLSIISEDVSDTAGEYKTIITLTVNYFDDRITSEKYKINYEKNYIYIGNDTDINVIKNNIVSSNIVSINIDLDNNKLLLKIEDEVIREYLIIRIISDIEINDKTIFTGHLQDKDITSNIKISHGKASVTADAILQVKYEDIILDEYSLIRISFSDLYLISDKKIYISNKENNDVKKSFYITNGEFSIDNNKIKITSNTKDITEINLSFVKTGKLKNKNKNIFIPKIISYNDFVSNVNISDEISFKIMKNNTEVTGGNIEAGMELKVYYDSKEIDSFNLIEEYMSFDKNINIDTETQIVDNVTSNKRVSYLINKIDTSGKIVIMNNKGDTLNNNDYIGTGSKVTIHFYDNTSQYTMMIKGDINGDGILSLEDINRIANYLYRDKNSLSDIYLNAADYDDNNSHNLEDVMKIAYKMKEKDNYENLASKIVNSYKESDQTIETTVGDIQYKLDTKNNLISDVAGNIRYYGSNPSNYIYFNCETYPDTNCEVWRIIGVFDGKVKIIRNESIGRLSYDFDYNNDLVSVTFNNKWAESSIKKLLNSAYLNNNDTKYYNYDYKNKKITENTLNFATSKNGIKDNTIDFISEAQYNVGGWYYNNRDMYADDIYRYEQGFDVYDNVNYQSKWTGKVALANISDYMYATDLTKCKETFNNYKLTCANENWMKNILTVDYAGWSINHLSISNEPSYVFNNATGGFANSRVTSPMYVNPVVQLNPNTNISFTGNGTYESPYRIILD